MATMINLNDKTSLGLFNIVSGVYQIENIRNNRVYIGQSNNIMYRIAGHVDHLYGERHSCSEMQDDFLEYGIGAFEFRVLERVSGNVKDLLDMENEYIISYLINGFNLYNKVSSLRIEARKYLRT